MNIKNKLLMLSFVLLKISAVLSLTESQKALVRECRDFTQYVLKPREADYDEHAAFTAITTMRTHPFDLIKDPDIQRIEDICRTIDELDFGGAGPELLVLVGFIFELLGKLDTENKELYSEKMIEFYQLAASETNIIGLKEKIENSSMVQGIQGKDEFIQSVQTTCRNLKSGNILTIEEQKSIKGSISGAYALATFGIEQESDIHIVVSFNMLAKRALTKPLDCGGCNSGVAILILAGVNAAELAPFAPFINYLICAANDLVYEPKSPYDVSVRGACLALMHACKTLGKTHINIYNADETLQ